MEGKNLTPHNIKLNDLINILPEVFAKYLVGWEKLKAEIDKTDAEINAIVYKLYGLSEEKIKIVKGC